MFTQNVFQLPTFLKVSEIFVRFNCLSSYRNERFPNFQLVEYSSDAVWTKSKSVIFVLIEMIFYNITGNTSEYMKRIILAINTIFIIFTHFMSDMYQVIVERDNLAPNYRSKLKTAIPNKKQLSFTTYKPGWIFGRIRALKMLWSPKSCPKLFDCLTFQFLPFFSLFCLFVCFVFSSLLWKLFWFFRQLFIRARSSSYSRFGDQSLVSACLYVTCTPPMMHLICPPKFCLTFVFHFSWVLQPSQEKLKTMLMQNFGGQIRCIMGDAQVAHMRWDGPCLVSL